MTDRLLLEGTMSAGLRTVALLHSSSKNYGFWTQFLLRLILLSATAATFRQFVCLLVGLKHQLINKLSKSGHCYMARIADHLTQRPLILVVDNNRCSCIIENRCPLPRLPPHLPPSLLPFFRMDCGSCSFVITTLVGHVLVYHFKRSMGSTQPAYCPLCE